MNGRDFAIYFYKGWKEKYGEPYSPSWAKHTTMFKRLLDAGHHVDSLCGYIDFYFKGYQDAFATKAGHRVEHFTSALPAIISAIKARHKQGAVATSNPDFEAIEEARKLR